MIVKQKHPYHRKRAFLNFFIFLSNNPVNGFASILANPGEGALVENVVYNQLRTYGELAYLSTGNEYELDFILTSGYKNAIGFEVKYHPVENDEKKVRRIARQNSLANSWIVGHYPTPDFVVFLGRIFLLENFNKLSNHQSLF